MIIKPLFLELVLLDFFRDLFLEEVSSTARTHTQHAMDRHASRSKSYTKERWRRSLVFLCTQSLLCA